MAPPKWISTPWRISSKDEICAERQRLLQHRRGVGAVDGESHTRPVSQVGQRGDVGEPKDRVGGGLDIHQASLRAQGFTHRPDVAGVDQGHVDAVAAGVQAQKLHASRVADLARHHVVAGSQTGEEHAGDGRHARGEGDTGLCALERGHLLLERAQRGVAPARVDVARPISPEQQGVHQLRPHLGQLEGGRHVDGRRHRPRGGIGLLARVDGPGVESVLAHVISLGRRVSPPTRPPRSRPRCAS